jgi:enterochelin esterase-like enzyme
MSLSGTVTTSVMWLVAAATFIWAVVSLAKATGTPGRVDLRTTYLRGAGTQLAVVATALLAVAGTLNAQYDWYSSWSDLGTAFQGGDSSAGSPELIRAGAGAAAAPIRTVREPQIRGLDPDPGPDGQYVTVTLLGPVSKVSSSVVLWLPRSYTQAGSAHRHYPVIEVFHGIPGSPREYSHDINLGKMVSGLAAAGRIREAILVMPDSSPHKVDTECVNGGRRGPAMETWLTKEVPNWVRHSLRVQGDRQSWATMGLSTGGFCSSMAAMLHPHTYGAAIELSGYLSPQFDAHYRPFAYGSTAWNRYDLVKVAARNPPHVALWIETSKTDSLSYWGNSRLIATAAAPMSVTADVLLDAGHRMSVWVAVMPTALQWLGSTMSGFRPQS